MAGGEPCLDIGQEIGSYKVVRQLGEGGMGEVYEVFDEELDRRAALKVVPPDLARNQDVVTRFQREAKALSQLRHPGIVHVFVYGLLPSLRNAPYFIMEYLEGDTLRVRIQRAAKEPTGRLGIAYLPIMQQIAKALAAVHQRGLVHRDLKPSNVILVADPDAPGGERAKLLDFGIVKVLQEAAAAPSDEIEGQTQRGTLLGTPLYMAPEQWTNHRRLDGKTDVYSLAVMIFLVLTGRMPFRAADMPALCFLHCNKTPPSLDSIDPTLPPVLVDLVARMLAKEPEHRPTMEEVAATLGTLVTGTPAPSSRPILPEPSELELVMESEGDERSGARIGKPGTLAGEHLPLVDPPSLNQPRPQVEPVHSQTLPVAPSSASVLPGWEDDYVATASLGAINAMGTGSLPAAVVNHPPELSDQSLLVGSQYNLRPVLSYRAWISTAALLLVVLLVVRFNLFRIGTNSANRGHTDGVAPIAPPPAPIKSPPAAPPPPEVVAKTKLKKNCQHMIPNASCIGSQRLSAPQQSAFFNAFLHSDASLCPGDRLVVAGLPDEPRLEVTPKTMPRKARASLLHDLKQLPGTLALPEQLEVLCPDPE